MVLGTMEWRFMGLVFCVLLQTLSAQEGYNYPTPSRPLSGASERPSTRPEQPSSPDRGYSPEISGPEQERPGFQIQTGYPGRGRPSGQDFTPKPQPGRGFPTGISSPGQQQPDSHSQSGYPRRERPSGKDFISRPQPSRPNQQPSSRDEGYPTGISGQGPEVPGFQTQTGYPGRGRPSGQNLTPRPQPGRFDQQPSSPDRGYSTGISSPQQTGYPGRGKPSSQGFISRPQSGETGQQQPSSPDRGYSTAISSPEPSRYPGGGRPAKPQPGEIDQQQPSFPDRGYSPAISSPEQTGYPGRGKPSGQIFTPRPQSGRPIQTPSSGSQETYPGRGRPSGPGYTSRPQGPGKTYLAPESTTGEYPQDSYGKPVTQDYSSQNQQNYPDQTYPGTSRPGYDQGYSNKETPEVYSESPNYIGQQGGYPSQKKGSSRDYPSEQVYPSAQRTSSQRYPSQQSNQNYPGSVRGNQGYSPETEEPTRFNQQQTGSQGQRNREQEQGINNVQGEDRFPENGEEDEGDYSAIPGEPDKDYPIFSEIPPTSFSCDEQQYPGYYADVEARCQVFHICANNKTYDFLCPNGTIFHQEYLVCVWWNQFDCDSAPSLYALNANIYDYTINGGKGFPPISGGPEDINQGSQTFEPQGPNDLPSGYPIDASRGQQRPTPSSTQQGYPTSRPQASGGYRNGGQNQPGRYPNEPTDNQRPQYSNGRPSFTPKPNYQEPNAGTNGYSSLEPGFPSTTPLQESGYSNGRSGTSGPQTPTLGYLPPFQ